MSLKIGLCVPTLNAGDEWKQWLDEFTKQDVRLSVSLIIDSSSEDQTLELAKQAGLSVHQIDRASFDHGATRQLGISMMGDMDVVVFLTQDAVLAAHNSISNLIAVFTDPEVGAAYGRQLPRKQASHIEAHARLFNYSDVSRINSFQDHTRLGIKTAFISNSFAAYRVSALVEVGGFPGDVIFGEDMYVASKLLKAGYKVAYAADASVYHSHAYTLWQEFRRYFDMGVFHARESWIRRDLGGAEGEGVKFVISELRYLLKHAFWRIPEGIIRTVFRYTGFRLGLAEKRLPAWLKRKVAMNKGYFKR